jgi:hypothetical protein
VYIAVYMASFAVRDNPWVDSAWTGSQGVPQNPPEKKTMSERMAFHRNDHGI